MVPLRARRPAPSGRVQDLLHALALLWHDRHDAAHELVQAREGDPDADLLHALLHRREGDYGNARYWFAAAGAHALYAAAALAAPARALGVAAGSGALDPVLMVEAVRAALAGERARAPVEALQHREFAALAALISGG